MIAAGDRRGGSARLLTVDRRGKVRHRQRAELANLFQSGDLIVANDAATLPASLAGHHLPSGRSIEVRLAGWRSLDRTTEYVAVVFGEGDFRTPTEQRAAPPPLAPGDRLLLGPLSARVADLLDHPRLVRLEFAGGADAVWAGIAGHGKPIQYAHLRRPVPLSNFWTPIAARPIAFEPPSAGFALGWCMIASWRRRGIGFATVTHAAGISSTGDAELDQRLPFDEPYWIPSATAAAIAAAKERGGKVVAIGTTVVRALETATDSDGHVHAGGGIASGRITRGTPLRVVDAILTGVHAPGESHYELLGAFASDAVLRLVTAASEAAGYRSHEFGDSILIDKARASDRPWQAPEQQPSRTALTMPA